MANLKDHKVISVGLPAPAPELGFISNGSSDQSRYILKPGTQFYQPWLANPGSTAFIWPGGTEGFSITSNAQAGIHHYLGSNGVDVDLVYPDEEHIVLTGNLPGSTGVLNMRALKEVILEPTKDGKILALPGVQADLAIVQVLNRQFNHDAGDSSRNVTYSIEFIRVGTGGKINVNKLTLPTPNPTSVTVDRGKSQNRTTVRGGAQTLRGVAAKAYGDTSVQSIKTMLDANGEVFKSLGVPRWKGVYLKLPPGTKLKT